jgi:hypothetical protein
MLADIQNLRPLAQQGLEQVQALTPYLKAPWWASVFPPATWYVVGKSLALDTRTYLAREELEGRFKGYLADLDEAERQAAALGDNEGNPADLLLLHGYITEDCGTAARLGEVIVQAQASSDKTLAQLPGAAEVPLDILKKASWLAKYGVWIAAAVVAVILFYAWRTGGLAAGAKKAAAKAAEAVS